VEGADVDDVQKEVAGERIRKKRRKGSHRAREKKSDPSERDAESRRKPPGQGSKKAIHCGKRDRYEQRNWIDFVKKSIIPGGGRNELVAPEGKKGRHLGGDLKPDEKPAHDTIKGRKKGDNYAVRTKKKKGGDEKF